MEIMPAGQMSNRWPKLSLSDLRTHISMHSADTGDRIEDQRVSRSNPMGSTHCPKSAPANPRKKTNRDASPIKKKAAKTERPPSDESEPRRSRRHKKRARSRTPPVKKRGRAKERVKKEPESDPEAEESDPEASDEENADGLSSNPGETDFSGRYQQGVPEHLLVQKGATALHQKKQEDDITNLVNVPVRRDPQSMVLYFLEPVTKCYILD